MKKLIKWAAASAAAALMISSLSFAQTPTTAPANSSGTVTPTSSDVSSSPAATPVDTTTAPASGSTTTVTPVGGTTTVTPVGGTTTVTPVSKTTTVTVVKVKPVPGFKVCYHSMQRHVEGTRIVQRCGPYGCRDFRITRDFYVTVYKDCHVSKSCDGFKTYGWYPNKMEARDARDRCQHTVNGNVPNEWRISTWQG
jgi:hypothetical protein